MTRTCFSPSPSKRAPLALAIALLAAPAIPIAVQAAEQPGATQSQVREYDIPAGPLNETISRFASAAGVALSFDAELTRGRTSPGLRGRYSVDDGFVTLLAGSGLGAQRQANGSYVLRQLPGGDALALGATTVTGATASVEALPAEYAGGQVAKGARLGMLGNTDVMNAPFNITSYTEQTIQNQQARSVADVLVNDPSAQLNSARTNLNEDFSLRGFPMASQDVALNGMYGLMPFFRVPVEMAERIEVLKGPSALLNGMPPSGSVGGAVNVVSKRAGDTPLARLTGSYLSDSIYGGQADLGRRFGEGSEFGVRFNGAYRNGDTTVDRQSLEESVGSLGLDYTGERLRLSADVIYQHEDIEEVVRQFQLGPGLTKVPHAPDNSTNYPGFGQSSMKDRTMLVRGEYDFTDWLTAYAGYGDRKSEMDALAGNPVLLNEAGDFMSVPAWQLYDVASHSSEAGLRSAFSTGPVDHQLTLGATRVIQNSDIAFAFSAFAPRASNIYDPVYSDTPSTAGLPSHPNKYTTSELTSYALADTLSFDDGRYQLMLGARHQQVEAQNFVMNVGTPSGEPYDESTVTPMAGVVYKPLENVSLYANYIEGLSQGETAPLGTSNAGEMFEPIETKQKEIGVKVDWGQLTTTLAAFEIERPSGAVENGRFDQNAEQRNRGLEFNVFGEVAPGVRLLGGASYIQAKLTSTANGTFDDNDAIGVPRKQLNLGGEWDLAAVPGLTLTARTIYAGQQYLDQANELDIPSWVRVDVGARYQTAALGKPVTLRANLDNLFDEDYWGASPFGYLYLGAGRTLQLSASVDF
ncbi:TonB-dependent receptor [Pseudomonas schmalbachii]|uniref:TonB-dependent receptor n=1 Tax=Pseudomonas schmalbachii TaxID=2816993 RepID=A0ABS3TNB1_9PSED|nr:TonB-dependent receptor [Pseudomonas schmalbachii]MBO3275152.1 TonB-dependent receptor [Pseudomonas schmalbachii]